MLILTKFLFHLTKLFNFTKEKKKKVFCQNAIDWIKIILNLRRNAVDC